MTVTSDSRAEMGRCPFCGGPARPWPRPRERFSVECDYCDAVGGERGSRTDAIAVWNQRAPHPCQGIPRQVGDERAVFEHWVRPYAYSLDRDESNLGYTDEAMDMAWLAWKHRAIASPPLNIQRLKG